MSREFRRAMLLRPISIAMRRTKRMARQICDYTEYERIVPARSKGSRRMFFLDDQDAPLNTRKLLNQGDEYGTHKKNVHDVK